jgi:hypothetical protein
MKKLIVLLSLISSPAFAEQPDPAFMQRAIAALQNQRNQALDAAAAAAAKAEGLSEDLVKAQARIKELEEKKPQGK